MIILQDFANFYFKKLIFLYFMPELIADLLKQKI